MRVFPSAPPGILDVTAASDCRHSTGAKVGVFVLSFLVLATAAAQSKQPEFNSANLPLVFTPNVGQDSANIRFSSRGLGYGIYFTREETVLTVPQPGSPPLRLRVASANPDATISGVDELPS